MKKNKLFLILSLIVLSLFSCDKDVEKFNFNSNEYQHLVNVWKNSLEPYSCEIAFFGDSRVIGADWVSAFPEYDIVNLGIGGDKIEDLLYRLCLLDALDVQRCFVSIGGNNALSNQFNATRFKTNYELLINELKNRNIEIYVNTIAPITNYGNNYSESFVKGKNDKINTANAIIRQLASDYEITLIDIAPLMTDAEGKLIKEYTVEGVHFSEAGNKLWFDVVKPYL